MMHSRSCVTRRTPGLVPGRRLICRPLILALCAATMPGTSLADSAAGAGTARWLLDRARNYEFTITRAPSVGDARTMLVWMRAATRVAPDFPTAWAGQLRLLQLLNQPREQGEVLTRYCTLAPDDEPRQLVFLTHTFERLQSAEERINLCEQKLGEPGVPAAIASELHRWLAQTYRGVGEERRAEQHALRALEACSFNFSARELLLDLRGTQAMPAERVGFLLSAVTATGGQDGEQTWALARLLDALALHEQAEQWYQVTAGVFARAAPGEPPPAALLLDLARSQRDRGAPAEAVELCRRALEADPASYEAALLLADCLRAAGRTEEAAAQIDRIAARVARAEEEVRRTGDGAAARRIAWFHLEYRPDAAKALEFAGLAHLAVPEDPLVERVYGLALLESGQPREARRILGPVAAGPDGDQFAAWGLARALLALGDKTTALEAARDAEQLRRSGPAYRRTVALLKELGAAPLPLPDRSRVIQTLAAFDRGVLDLAVHPNRYLSLEAAFAEPKPPFGRRWACRFTLTNRASFPITVGQGQTVTGLVQVSLATGVARAEPLEAYLTLSLNQAQVLGPGQSVSLVETVDVGPAAELPMSLAQRPLPVTLTALLDPVPRSEGGWHSAFDENVTATARLLRKPVRYTSGEMAEVVRLTRAPAPDQRLNAYRVVVGLLAERLAAMRQQPDYEPVRIDKTGLEKVLARALTDPDPIVRARVLDSMRLLDFGDNRVQAIAPLLADGHWLVRLIALDVLAQKQGTVFEPVVLRLAQSDPDELIRELAALYLERWRAEEALEDENLLLPWPSAEEGGR